MANVAKDKIVVKGVTIQGVFEMTAMSNRGVEEIREVFTSSKDLAEQYDATVNIYTLGAPKYRIEITSDDYKKAENVLDLIVKQVTEEWVNHEGSVAFKRD